MALIKCPECKNNISDQAETCPKCGYELKKQKTTNNTTKTKQNFNFNNKYLLIGIVLVVVVIYFLNTTSTNNNNNEQNPQTPQTPQTPEVNSGFIQYNDTNLKVKYEIPSNYKTFVDTNGLSYVGKNIDNEGALIPYIVLGWSANYSDPAQFLNAFTDELRTIYNDVTITVNILSNTIGSYYVYGIQYKYTSSGHIVIDNRYATTINGKIFMIGTKEENVNTNEINEIVRVMFNTLQGGN